MECSSAKRSYLTNASAMRIARRQMTRQKQVVLRVYRCEECKQWHLTSTPQLPALRVLNYQRMKRDWAI